MVNLTVPNKSMESELICLPYKHVSVNKINT